LLPNLRKREELSRCQHHQEEKGESSSSSHEFETKENGFTKPFYLLSAAFLKRKKMRGFIKIFDVIIATKYREGALC
jgi:hypothetical protein